MQTLGAVMVRDGEAVIRHDDDIRFVTHAERFDWNHRYGPINWPRSGRTLLMVKSAEPHYWKAETLDYFDGLRWSHTAAGDNIPIDAELPIRTTLSRANPVERRRSGIVSTHAAIPVPSAQTKAVMT